MNSSTYYMLNPQYTKPVVLQEKVDLNVRGSFMPTWPGASGIIEFILLRNSADNTFNLETRELPGAYEQQSFIINNKTYSGAKPNAAKMYKAHSSALDSITLDKAKSISVMAKSGRNQGFVTASMFPIFTPIDKDVKLGEHEYIKLRTINKIEVRMKYRASTTLVEADSSVLSSRVTFTDTYIVPKTFGRTQQTSEMFDIYVSNEDGLDTEGDISYFPGELTTSTTGSSKIKLNSVPYTGLETFESARKTSTLNVFDYTYFDYDKNKMTVGFGKDAKKGVCVPFNFSGDLLRRYKISPNAVVPNMNVLFDDKIDRPLLDPYEGKVVLHVDDVEEEEHKWRIISSEDFERLEDTDPSLSGLERISYEENI